MHIAYFVLARRKKMKESEASIEGLFLSAFTNWYRLLTNKFSVKQSAYVK